MSATPIPTPTPTPNPTPSEKEVIMDVQEGGSGKTRRRRRRRTGSAVTDDADKLTTVTKADSVGAPVAVVAKPVAVAPAPAAVAAVAVPKKPIVVLAPPKKKVPKVMLVPKGKPTVKPDVKKTFKAKRIRVVLNNTVKAQNKRRRVVESIDSMSDDRVRAVACAAHLSRRETVGKVPITLLKQMIKDYQLMKMH